MLTLNHCLIRDVKVQAVTVAFIAGLISAICPNILCKGVVTGIAAFVEAQVVLLGNADELCNGNGAILEIGSFKDKTLWTINNVCNLSPGHLTVTDNNPDGESNLRCYASNSSTPINLSFTVQNTGQESVKWHISIYSKDHYHPQNLKVYVGVDNHHIRSGLTPDLYDAWGTTPNHGTPLVIKGQVTPGEVKQHGHQLTISFIAGSGSDSQNPPPITMSCA